MRRPICVFSLAFLAIVFIYLKIIPIPSLQIVQEGDRISCKGTVCYKEYRNHQLILYLNRVVITQKSNQDVFFELPRNQKVICYLDSQTEPKYYSEIMLSGAVSEFLPAKNPGEFDAKNYYRLQKVEFSLKKCKLDASKRNYSVYHEMLYLIRNKLEEVFDHFLSESDSAFFKALILGNKHSMGKQQKELYQNSGISHIMAISGLHITILGAGLYKLLERLKMSRKWSILLPVVCMWVYGDLVGMSSSAKRAIMMFGLQMFAHLWGRRYDIYSALAVSSLLILWEQPLYLYHAGFLLSFSAVLGILIFPKIIEDNFQELPFFYKYRKTYLYKAWIGNLSIFLAQLPIVLYFFYQYPMISFLINLFVIPMVPILFMLGLGLLPVSLTGFLTPLYAMILHAVIAMLENVCRIMQIIPGAVWITGRPQTINMVFYVVLLAGWMVCSNKKVRKMINIPPVMKCCMILAAVLMLTKQPQDGAYISYLSVGQGNCTWVKTQEGKHYLIDGGSSSETRIAEKTIEPFLKYMGTGKLEGVFLTHLDEDHASGIEELITRKQISIQTVYLSDKVLQDEKLQEFLTLCEKNHVKVQFLSAGSYMENGKEKWTIWYPFTDSGSDSRNNQSMVIGFEYGDFFAIFPGDISADGEKTVLESLPKDIKCNVLLSAHHGSQNSNSSAFFNAVKPDHIIISCGKNNAYHHPHSEAVKRMEQAKSQIWITANEDNILVHCQLHKYEIKSLQNTYAKHN